MPTQPTQDPKSLPGIPRRGVGGHGRAVIGSRCPLHDGVNAAGCRLAAAEQRQHQRGEPFGLLNVRVPGQNETVHADLGVGPELGRYLVRIADDRRPTP